MSQDQRSRLPEDSEVTRDASRENTRKLEQAMNLVANIGEDEDTHALDTLAHLVPAALQKVVEKLRQERQWDFLWFILEVEMIRQRIEELDRMIEEWQRENEFLTGEIDVLQKSISLSRKREQELRQAEDQRDFDRDPQTGRFRNKAVEQAVNDYERRYGPVNKNNPDMLVLVLQWAQQQEQQAQADWQSQVNDKQDRIDQNLRKIDKAMEEKKELEASLPQGEYRHTSNTDSAHGQSQFQSSENDALQVLAGSPTTFDTDDSDAFDFLPGVGSDEGQPSPTDKTHSALDSGGIQCSIDLGTEFTRAVEGLEPETVLLAESAPLTSPEFKPA